MRLGFANPLSLVERVFYLCRETCLGGASELWRFILHLWMFTGWVLHSTLLYVPPNYAQCYDFTGLTPNNYMDMDLSPIFGLNSRFGAVLEGNSRVFPHWVRSHSLNSIVYQRVLGRGFSDLLEDSAPALPVICRSFSEQWSLSHWRSCASVRAVTVECDEKSVADKAATGRTLSCRAKRGRTMSAVPQTPSRKAREGAHPQLFGRMLKRQTRVLLPG